MTAARWLAGLVAVLGTAVAVVPAHGAYTSGSLAAQAASSTSAYAQAQRDLAAAEAQVALLTQQVADAQAQLADAERRVVEAKAREDALRARISVMARDSYQTEGTQLIAVLQATSITDLWSAMAEARLVSDRERTLLDQFVAIRKQAEAARDQARAHLADVQRQEKAAEAQVVAIEARMSSLAAAVTSAGTILTGAVGKVPAAALSTTTGVAGQCTWYAEQAWATYSDQSTPQMTGNGGDVVRNLASAMGRSVEYSPQPGSLISWAAGTMSAYGHVALVASVDKDASGNITGYTVWEMNYEGPYVTDARHVAWTGPSSTIMFLSPPSSVDPIAEAATK